MHIASVPVTKLQNFKCVMAFAVETTWVSLLRVMVIYNCRCLFLTNPIGGATTLSCVSWTDYQNANVEVSKDYLNKVIKINDTHMY